MAQGDEPNAKDDTRFYSTTSAGLEVDLSQLADDITAGASWYYESGAQARWDVGAPACWELDVSMDNTDTGYLYSYEPVNAGVRLELSAGGVVDAYVNNTQVATVTAPGIAGAARPFAISWSMEANPLTTGASDAVRSELRIYNISTGAFAQDVVTHFAVVSGSATAIWLASSIAGANNFTGTPNEFRFGAGRFHPASEAREDFVANTTAPTLTLEERKEVPVPTRDSGIGDDNWFTGPVYMAVAAGLGQSDLRTAGHIANERYRDQPDQDESPPANRALTVPDASAFTFVGQYLKFRPCPQTVNRLKVRVQIQAFRVDANPADNVVIRAYSMNRPPVVLPNVPGPTPAWERTFETVTVTSADGSGTTGGDWYTFDLLEITRTQDGRGTWVALAFDVTDAGGAGSTADQRWRVRSWTVEPGVEEVDGGQPLP